MCSTAKEEIPLCKLIDTKEDPVEIWCKILENEMIDTMRDAILRAVKHYTEIHRKEWVKFW